MRCNFNIINRGELVFNVLVYIVAFIMVSPIVIIIILSFSSSGFNWPPSGGFTLKWYIDALNYKGFITGMSVSFKLAIVSSLIASVLGTMASFVLVRYHFRGKEFLNIIFMSPLMVPGAISGLAIFMFLSRYGSRGGMFSLIIGHTILLTPFSLRLITASLQRFDRSLEEAAINVGAGAVKVFTSITLPLIKTAVISGMLLSFLVSWNNFSLSLFLAGPGAYPLPLQLYDYIKFEWSPVVLALASVLICISGVIVIIIDRIVGISVAMGATKP